MAIEGIHFPQEAPVVVGDWRGIPANFRLLPSHSANPPSSCSANRTGGAVHADERDGSHFPDTSVVLDRLVGHQCFVVLNSESNLSLP